MEGRWAHPFLQPPKSLPLEEKKKKSLITILLSIFLVAKILCIKSFEAKPP